MFVSPIAFTIDMVPEGARALLCLNPLTFRNFRPRRYLLALITSHIELGIRST